MVYVINIFQFLVAIIAFTILSVVLYLNIFHGMGTSGIVHSTSSSSTLLSNFFYVVSSPILDFLPTLFWVFPVFIPPLLVGNFCPSFFTCARYGIMSLSVVVAPYYFLFSVFISIFRSITHCFEIGGFTDATNTFYSYFCFYSIISWEIFGCCRKFVFAFRTYLGRIHNTGSLLSLTEVVGRPQGWLFTWFMMPSYPTKELYHD